MSDSNVSPWAVIALEMILIGISIHLIHLAMLRHRFLIRKLPTELGPIRRSPFVLIYFTAPTSILCKAVQGPAIENLRNRLGSGLQVLVIDIAEQPELASLWGVWSVPTTFLINPRGELNHINHGVARAETLLMQMYDIDITDPTDRT